jgi:hypothetical protein
VIATFCLRLAAGLILMLPTLPTEGIPPRFFRVHFLTALGLLAAAGIFAADVADMAFWLTFSVAIAGCLIGSIVWHLNEAPGGKLVVYLVPIAVLACLIQGGMLLRGDADRPLLIADDVAGALVLGSATTAMLMGHSYLISPSMSISPLMRLLAALGISVLLRIGLMCVALWAWTEARGSTPLTPDLMAWLPVRWTLGLVAPLVLGWMAWESARIRSTQSATGILYVVVIVSFLGELTSQLLVQRTGYGL